MINSRRMDASGRFGEQGIPLRGPGVQAKDPGPAFCALVPLLGFCSKIGRQCIGAESAASKRHVSGILRLSQCSGYASKYASGNLVSTTISPMCRSRL